jgi:hypothetical protein
MGQEQPDFVHPANVEEVANVAREVGAEVLRGPLTYPSETGGLQLGDLDPSEYLQVPGLRDHADYRRDGRGGGKAGRVRHLRIRYGRDRRMSPVQADERGSCQADQGATRGAGGAVSGSRGRSERRR